MLHLQSWNPRHHVSRYILGPLQQNCWAVCSAQGEFVPSMQNSSEKSGAQGRRLSVDGQRNTGRSAPEQHRQPRSAWQSLSEDLSTHLAYINEHPELHAFDLEGKTLKIINDLGIPQAAILSAPGVRLFNGTLDLRSNLNTAKFVVNSTDATLDRIKILGGDISLEIPAGAKVNIFKCGFSGSRKGILIGTPSDRSIRGASLTAIDLSVSLCSNHGLQIVRNSYVKITNSTIRDCGWDGINITGYPGRMLEATCLTLNNNRYSALSAGDVTHVLLRGCTATGNKFNLESYVQQEMLPQNPLPPPQLQQQPQQQKRRSHPLQLPQQLLQSPLSSSLPQQALVQVS